MKKLLSSFLRYLFPGVQKSDRTVKQLFTLIVGIIALLGASVLTSQNASSITLKSSKNVVLEGEEFTLGVYAYAHVPVNAVSVTIGFPAEFIDVVGVDTGKSVITIWTEEPRVRNNSVLLSGGTYRRGFVGEHLIAELTVRAKKSGQTSFSTKDISLLAGDGSGSAVQVVSNASNQMTFSILAQGSDPSVIEAAITGTIREDIDGDGTVNLRDISLFMNAWFNKNTLYDFNKDSKMNFADFSILLARSFTIE